MRILQVTRQFHISSIPKLQKFSLKTRSPYNPSWPRTLRSVCLSSAGTKGIITMPGFLHVFALLCVRDWTQDHANGTVKACTTSRATAYLLFLGALFIPVCLFLKLSLFEESGHFSPHWPEMYSLVQAGWPQTHGSWVSAFKCWLQAWTTVLDHQSCHSLGWYWTHGLALASQVQGLQDTPHTWLCH